MKNLYGLTTIDRQKLINILSSYPEINKVIIYGSRTKGNFTPSSDIDLTIIGKLDWQTFNKLESELDDALLPYQIDLSLFSQIENPILIDHINRKGKTFYSKSN